jgi:hypothetical protein
MNDQELERRYGPAASYSDYRRGERIVFSEAGRIYSGIIIWVCAPQQRFSGHTPSPMWSKQMCRAPIPSSSGPVTSFNRRAHNLSCIYDQCLLYYACTQVIVE